MKSRLEALKKVFESSGVKTVVVSDIRGLTLPDGSVLNASKGEEIEVPRWLAKYLEERGLVRRRWGELELEDILRIHYRELDRKSVRDLTPLPQHFYWLAREYLQRLDELIKSNPTPVLLDERRKAETYIKEIVDRRIRAIASMAVGGGDASIVSGRLSPEEQELMKELKRVISEWKKIVLGGGESD